MGGAISSGALGGGLPGDGSQMASSVLSLTLINGMGRKVEISQKLPDLLVLTRMSYGLLGIVYSVKLRIRPIRAYTVRTSKFDFDERALAVGARYYHQLAIHAGRTLGPQTARTP